MNRKDICVGMKVVPLKKTVFLNNQLIDSLIWKRAKNKGQDYLFVTNTDIFLNTVRLNDKKEDDNEGELFYPEDFEPYRKMVNQVYITMLVGLVKQGLITVGDIRISEYKDAVNTTLTGQ